MTSKDILADYLHRSIPISNENADQFVDAFEEYNIKKRQFIVQPDFLVKNRNFVVKGAFRAYVIDDKGQDCTIAFAIEDWWITD